MKKNIILLVLCLAFSFSFGLEASERFSCTTPRLSKAFVVGPTGIAFFNPFEKQGRKIASTINARTKLIGKGFSKILFVSGEKHIVHINDKQNLNELDDYLIIKSNKGHEITYPLDCKLI